jgi:hypothetical protein
MASYRKDFWKIRHCRLIYNDMRQPRTQSSRLLISQEMSVSEWMPWKMKLIE